MLKKVTKIALVGIIGLGTLIGSSSFAFAEQTAEYKSKAKIQFTENEEITTPVDPTDLTEPVEPTDPNDEPILPGTAGPLSIDYASHFNFGTITKTANAAEYVAEPITVKQTNLEDVTKEVAPYVQVTDNRGSNSGWTLSVDQEGQLKTENGEELLGAEIIIGKGQASGTLLPDGEGLTTNEVALTPEIGSAQEIFGAAVDTVGGTFVSSFGSATDVDVKLTIPAGTKIETAEYTTDLNWTLEDTPLN